MEQRRQRVSSAGGENPVDDGHSWRKYGQKEILGAKHPRLAAPHLTHTCVNLAFLEFSEPKQSVLYVCVFLSYPSSQVESKSFASAFWVRMLVPVLSFLNVVAFVVFLNDWPALGRFGLEQCGGYNLSLLLLLLVLLRAYDEFTIKISSF